MENVSWNEAKTFEEAIREAIEAGKEKDLIPLLSILPIEKKEKYRKLWKEIKANRNVEKK